MRIPMEYPADKIERHTLSVPEPVWTKVNSIAKEKGIPTSEIIARVMWEWANTGRVLP